MLKIIPFKTLVLCAFAVFAGAIFATGPASAQMWYYLMMQNQKTSDEVEKQWKNEPLPFELSKGLHRFQVLTAVLEAREQVCSLKETQDALDVATTDRCRSYGEYVVYGQKVGVSRQIVLGKLVAGAVQPLVEVNSTPGMDGLHKVTELSAVDWFDALTAFQSRKMGEQQ